MNHIWKRSIWAALLTMATLFAAGCSDDNGTNSANQSAVPAITAANGSSAVVSDTFVYTMNEDNTITITDYTGDAEILMIPDTIDGFAVTKIGDHAFEANWNLTSVTLPNGLISISRTCRLMVHSSGRTNEITPFLMIGFQNRTVICPLSSGKTASSAYVIP